MRLQGPEDGPAKVVGTALDALVGDAAITPGSELGLGDAAGCLEMVEVRSFDSEPELRIEVPAFEIEAAHDLLANASFSGLTTASDTRFGHFPHLADEPLAIGAATQTATAAFSDRGFRAAATTMAMAVTSGFPPSTKKAIRVDHNRPFGFVALDRRSGLVVFTGWIDDVAPMSQIAAPPLDGTPS
jgi:serine protease inhibitor